MVIMPNIVDLQYEINVAVDQLLPREHTCKQKPMSRKKSVRFGRVPKREKARIMAAMRSVSARTQEKKDILADLENEQNVISAIIRAHLDTCEFTREKVSNMMQKARSRPVYSHLPQMTQTCPFNLAPLNGQGQQEVIKDFSERFAPAIHGVVKFARGLPGFLLLPEHDQATLLKTGAFEVLLVHLASMFDSRSNTMLCLNGMLLKRDALQSSTNARFLMDSMFDFTDRLNALNLTDAEIALFCAIVVLAHDRPGLRNCELVERIRHRLVAYLQNVVAQNHPGNPNLHLELLNKIPDLRTLNTLHSDKLILFKNADQSNNISQAWEDSSRGSWEEKEGSLGSPTSSWAADEAGRSPVSCSESAYCSESGSSADSGCGSETTEFADIRGPYAHFRHSRDAGRSPVSCSDTSFCPESRNSADSACGNEATEFTDIAGAYAQFRRRKENGRSRSPVSRSESKYSSESPVSAESETVDYSDMRGPYAHYRRRREALRSPVSCSESVYSESASPADSETTEYTEITGPYAHCRRRRDYSEGASSGDEAVESPITRKIKLDSLDDSGIESGTEKSDKLSSTSVCSSPSWSIIGNNMDEKCTLNDKCEDAPEDYRRMPRLLKLLQEPPMINTDQRIEEAYKSDLYKSHSDYRAFSRDEDQHQVHLSSSTVSSANSILKQRLSQPLLLQSRPTSSSPKPKVASPYLVKSLQEIPKNHEDAMRKADMIGAMIRNGQKCPAGFIRSHNNSHISSRVSPAPYFDPQSVSERLSSPSSWSSSSRSCTVQSSSVAHPRAHLLTTPTPSRCNEPRSSIATPVGLSVQPSSSTPSMSCSQGSGLGAQPSRGHCSPMMELQVDIADSQPLNLSTKTQPPTPQEFALEA